MARPEDRGGDFDGDFYDQLKAARTRQRLVERLRRLGVAVTVSFPAPADAPASVPGSKRKRGCPLPVRRTLVALSSQRGATHLPCRDASCRDTKWLLATPSVCDTKCLRQQAFAAAWNN